MTRIYAFPGQGSQTKGMGADLFDLFPEHLAQADEILGYSMRTLCEEDRHNQLRLTQFTQPSLYTVCCFTYLKTLQEKSTSPDFLIGHSLGEFAALFAAGAFSFADGLKIVKKRGELMSQASGGGMAAVLGFPLHRVEAILQNAEFENLTVANYNATTQTILSGALADIARADTLFSNAGAKFVPLNVSAAFHSRLMEPARREFAEFIKNFDMLPLIIPVMSNVTAQPYPRQNYCDLIVDQITHPVRWLEIVSRLNLEQDPEFEELGPGTVLSKLYFNIKENPAHVEKLDCRYSNKTVDLPRSKRGPQSNREINNLFMFGGPGSHFFHMGKTLYQEDELFCETVNECAEIAHPIIGANFAQEVYDAKNPYAMFDSTAHALPAVFAVSFALYRVLQSRGIRPDALLGYGLGEITAWAAGGAFDIEQAVTLVANLAVLAERHTEPTQGLLVLADEVEVLLKAPALQHCEITARNYEKNIVLTGTRADIAKAKSELKAHAIASQELPLSRGFHSQFIDPIKQEFEHLCSQLAINAPGIPVYSASMNDWVDMLEPAHLWLVVSKTINFAGAQQLHGADVRHWIDLTPSGSLANFVKYGSGGKIKPLVLLTPFGHNLPFNSITSKRSA